MPPEADAVELPKWGDLYADKGNAVGWDTSGGEGIPLTGASVFRCKGARVGSGAGKRTGAGKVAAVAVAGAGCEASNTRPVYMESEDTKFCMPHPYPNGSWCRHACVLWSCSQNKVDLAAYLQSHPGTR